MVMTCAQGARPVKRLTSKGERTRAAILDAAERQFAERGFDGVSLRQIIEEASVQMGQLQYYFPSKEDMFAGVLDRRIDEVIDGYAEAIASLDGAAELGLSELIRAVTRISRSWLTGDDVGRHRYLRMLGLATMNYSQPDYVARHTQAFRPLNNRVVEEMERVFPDAPRERVLAAYYLIEANLLSLYVNLDALLARTGSVHSAAAVGQIYDDLEGFLVGGVERLLGPA